MTVIFDGAASGLLLFLISVGLSVTLGLMNFVNLAHGAFAMLGGYACVVLLNRFGVPFLAAVPLAALACAAAGVLLERTLYRRLYGASHLDQVLFSIGLVFMSISTANYFFGAQQQPLQLPAKLTGQFNLPGLDIGVYRLFLIVVGLGIAFGRVNFPFSDGATLIANYGRATMLQPDWRRLFSPASVRKQVQAIVTGQVPPPVAG